MKQRRHRRVSPEIQALIDIRHKAGLTQTDIAKRAKVSVSTVSLFEKGRGGHERVQSALEEAYHLIETLGISRSDRGGALDSSWLRRQTISFLKQNCLGVIEQKQSHLAHFVLSSEDVYQFGRLILLASGKHVD